MCTGAQTLSIFCDLPDFSSSDKDRFYRVQTRDSSSIVALNKVTLVSITGESREERFRSKTNQRVHAEKLVIKHLNKMLHEEGTSQLKEIRLVTMATASPCSECITALKRMLEYWRRGLGLEVHYTLRVAYFYGGKKNKLKVGQELLTWKKMLEEIGVNFESQPIPVCKELRDHKIRLVRCKTCRIAKRRTQCEVCKKMRFDCLRKRREADEEILREIRKINAVNSTVRDYFPRVPCNTN